MIRATCLIKQWTGLEGLGNPLGSLNSFVIPIDATSVAEKIYLYLSNLFLRK